MTDSREAMWRKGWREHERLRGTPTPPATRLQDLCLIQGCLTRKVPGRALCDAHERETDTRAELTRRRWAAQDEKERTMTDPEPDPANAATHLALRVLLLGALTKGAKQLTDAAKAELQRTIPPGTTLRPAVDGTPVGSVTRTAGRTTATVPDEQRLVDWVMSRYPTEVDMVVTVRPAFRSKLIDLAEANGIPLGPGGETAEDAPPITVVEGGSGYISARPAKDQAALIWSTIRAELPALTEGVTA